MLINKIILSYIYHTANVARVILVDGLSKYVARVWSENVVLGRQKLDIDCCGYKEMP